jgi:type I restriction enzyme M protein
MVALKGKPDIGDQINKKIIGPLANANKLSDMPDFNDATKLGSGKEMVDRLTNLIAIFENRRSTSRRTAPTATTSSATPTST